MPTYIRIPAFSADALVNCDGSEVVVTPEFVLFWKPPGPFSQWTASRFEIDGARYNCAEQYMMAEKARLFGDAAVEKQILQSDSPRQHKKLGQRVARFTEERWVAARRQIVSRGNLAKFTQQQGLKACLLETDDRRLVEASPFDKIWGIGLAATDSRAYDPQQWSGLNLLGKALEDVRDWIRAN